jgi:hypothetical protein
MPISWIAAFARLYWFMMAISRWPILIAQFALACATHSPRTPQVTGSANPASAGGACPARDDQQPLLPPGAMVIEGRGMATTINPGMNVHELHYRVEAMPARDVEEFYRNCLGPESASDTFTESVHGQGAGALATRTYEIQREAGVTVVRVRCEGCY